MTVLATGLLVGESPRWHNGRLWLANWGAAEILAIDPHDGTLEVMAHVPTRIPFCLDWLPDGRMLVVSGAEGLLLRRESDGSFVTHADLRGLSLHPWNEIVVDGHGNTYINSVGFDVLGGGTPAPGVIALMTPDGELRLVSDDVLFPNGMAILPDGATLIVAESYASRLTAFDITSDGSLSNRRTWADLGHAAPDGICVDAEGAVWYGDVPHRRCVRVREGGEVLNTVELHLGCFACMLGGDDGTTLFVVAAPWRGPQAMFSGPPGGQVIIVSAPAPRAGWP